MEVTNQENNADRTAFPMQENTTTINFLQRFVPVKLNDKEPCTDSKTIDLNLKLALDGPWGQNADEKSLTKSPTVGGETTQSILANGPRGISSVPFIERSCSLSPEAGKGLIRFGDLQAMRRVETGKRLLLEKQKRAAAAAAAKGDNSPAVSLPPLGPRQQPVPPEVVARASDSASKNPAIIRAVDRLKMVANPYGDSMHEGRRGLTEAGTNQENSSKKSKLEKPCSLKGDSMDILRQMPSVTTTGDGPNGQRIEGFLYQYRRGQVCIVCICHGSFLSPAEFVQHAGGKEVANPMRHITVCSSSF